MSKFYCKCCNFSCERQQHFENHLKTNKHVKNNASTLENNEDTLEMLENENETIMSLKLKHAQEVAQHLQDKIDIYEKWTSTIMKKTRQVSNYVSEEEPEQLKESKLKKCPGWTPNNGFEELESQLIFTYEDMDSYKKENENGKQVNDYDTFILEIFKYEKQKNKFMLDGFCEVLPTTFFAQSLKLVQKKENFPLETIIRKFLKEKINNDKLISVKDSSRCKFYLFGNDKWNTPEDSMDLIWDLVEKIRLEVKHQGCIFNTIGSNDYSAEDVMNSYNLIETKQSFINKLLKEI
jgi:hypothetical protein